MNTPDTMIIPIARAYLWPNKRRIPSSVIPVYRKTNTSISNANGSNNHGFIGLINITVELVQKVLWEELRSANVAQPIPWSRKVFRREWLKLINNNVKIRDKLFSNPEVKAEIERQFELLRIKDTTIPVFLAKESVFWDNFSDYCEFDWIHWWLITSFSSPAHKFMCNSPKIIWAIRFRIWLIYKALGYKSVIDMAQDLWFPDIVNLSEIQLHLFKLKILSTISSRLVPEEEFPWYEGFILNKKVWKEKERQYAFLCSTVEGFFARFEWVEDPLLKPIDNESARELIRKGLNQTEPEIKK